MSGAGVIVVTGASSGIGRSTALLFGRAGWRVGLLARGEAGLAEVREVLLAGGTVAASAVCDVADGTAVEAAAAALEEALGPIGVWVNCAGNGVFGRFLDVPAAEFDRVTAVTYGGTVNGTRAALRLMVPRNHGVVVNVCSAVAFHGLPVLSSYAGAKRAVRGFGESVRHELAGDGSRVRLVTVYPPAVNTPFFSHAPSHGLAGVPRPARPVYAPEVVADAVMLAVRSRRTEVVVSGTVVVFDLACRLVPGAISWAMRRLGSAGQVSVLGAAVERHAPTLWAPGLASGSHGPFGAEARGWSGQMWLAWRPWVVMVAVLVAAVMAAVAVGALLVRR